MGLTLGIDVGTGAAEYRFLDWRAIDLGLAQLALGEATAAAATYIRTIETFGAEEGEAISAYTEAGNQQRGRER